MGVVLGQSMAQAWGLQLAPCCTCWLSVLTSCVFASNQGQRQTTPEKGRLHNKKDVITFNDIRLPPPCSRPQQLLAPLTAAPTLRRQPGAIELRNMYFNASSAKPAPRQSKAERMAQGVRAYWQIGPIRWPLWGWPGRHACVGHQTDYSSDRKRHGLLKRGQSDQSRPKRTNPVSLAPDRKLALDNHVLRWARYCPQLPLAMLQRFPNYCTGPFVAGWLQAKAATLELRPGPLRCDQPARLRRPSTHDASPGGARNVIVSGKRRIANAIYLPAPATFNDNTRASYTTGELDGLYRQTLPGTQTTA